MYSKTAAKNGKHAAATDSSKISAVSNLCVQVFEKSNLNLFSPISQNTFLLSTNYFQFIPSIRFMVPLPPSVVTLQLHGELILEEEALNLFKRIKSEVEKLAVAIKLFKERKGNDDSGDKD